MNKMDVFCILGVLALTFKVVYAACIRKSQTWWEDWLCKWVWWKSL